MTILFNFAIFFTTKVTFLSLGFHRVYIEMFIRYLKKLFGRVIFWVGAGKHIHGPEEVERRHEPLWRGSPNRTEQVPIITWRRYKTKTRQTD